MTNKLFNSLEEAEDFLIEHFGDGESFDVGIKHLFVKDLLRSFVHILAGLWTEKL